MKLYERSIPHYILQLIVRWYENLSSAVLWQSSLSRSFPIKQGVRQGAILSPLLYSVFVDDLLMTLQKSGYGVHIDSIFCGAPMYADDLALICDSPTDLQAMLNIVSSYASFWRYKINADKSCIMVFGESPQSRLKNRLSRAWYINNSIIPECDGHHHLGILRSVLPSSIYRTTERCPHWQITRGQPTLTRKNNFRIRLLVGCDGLEQDASRFRHRSLPAGDNRCKLCLLEPEDASHFIARCPALSGPRSLLLTNFPTPPSVPPLLELLHSNPSRLIDIVLGVEWIDDADFQCGIIILLNELRLARTALLT